MPLTRLGPHLVMVSAIVGSLFVIAPAAPAAAAEGLRITADTTYDIRTSEGLIAVTSDITLTNVTPNRRSGSTITQTYYYGVNLAIPLEADNVKATSGGRDLTVTVTEGEEGMVNVAEIPLRSRLYYQQTHTIQLTFDFIGAEPRSEESSVRVNDAFVWFYAWAFGDPDRATVRVIAPEGMDINISDEPMTTSTAEDGRPMWVAADIAEPDAWFVIVDGWSEEGLASGAVDVDGDRVNVRFWPGDTQWRDDVIEAVERGVPALVETLGQEWPAGDRLVIRETVEPNAFGFSGWYLFGDDLIEIGEMVDREIVLHEISHAWFNEDLFDARWITEGLAQAVTEMILFETFGEQTSPEQVGADDRGYHRLNTWMAPDDPADVDEDEESYGYNASWIVVGDLLDEIGGEGLREVLAAARNDEIAYVGAGVPESVPETDDWRRFLDLAAQRGGATSGDELFLEYVVRATEEALFEARGAARTAYADLVSARAGWSPSILIREPMSDWEYDEAMEHITAAGAVLDAVASLEDHAGELDLEALLTIEPAYETVRWSFDGVLFIVADQESALAAIEAATEVVGADRDEATLRGLEGLDPDAELAAGREAFQANDLEGARFHAALASEMVEHAPAVGQARLDAESLQRNAAIAAGVVALLLLAAGLFVGWRRRHRSVRTSLEDGIDAAITEPGSSPHGSELPQNLAGPGDIDERSSSPDSADTEDAKSAAEDSERIHHV